ncbi:MAG: UDP-N-acetylmuramoyl-tripeptide--D-alanyl-D-alanine ligase [Minisyncoccia bacterium]
MQPFLRNIVVHILTWEAQLALKRYQPKIIAVTGSAGKTTTKDAIFCVLSDGRHVRKSEKSYNSELGVPLTILGLESGWGSPWRWLLNILKRALVVARPHEYPEWLVLEVGADRPGDIRNIARWLRPNIAVITSIPDVPVHVEFFNSPHALANEKKRLAEYLKHDGILVINGDDVHTKNILHEHRDQAVSFGFEGQNAFVATEAGIQYENKRPVGMHFFCNHSGTKLSVSLFYALGKPRVYSALAALAVAESVGVSQEQAADALRAWEPPPGRMRILEGIKGSLIIDDTYNSSPVAAAAALDTLKEIKHFKKKIACLGDMLELGRFSKDAHMAIGKQAAKTVKQLVTVGFRARAIAESALDAGLPESVVRQYDANESVRAGKELEPDIDKNTIILIKGSQGMRMEKTVEEIMGEPLRAEELLVRQDEDWRER